MTATLDADLPALANARIFFGHQSVGANILAGVSELLAGRTSGLGILEHGTAASLPPAFLLHARVGRNEHPVTKCDDFRRLVDEELAGRVDIALLKFCYIDINERTDVDRLFAQYKAVMDDLVRRHPDITFVHVTAPLRHTPGGVGVIVREMLGRPNRGKLANIQRNRFNDLLRKAYAGAPIFDLAASQSTHPDGRRESFRKNGATYYSLIGDYTDDGGHLNHAGRAAVAADFVRCLAAVARTRQRPQSPAGHGR